MKIKYLPLILGLSLISCSGSEEKTTETFEVSKQDEISLTDAQMKITGIQTASMEEREMARKITLNGILETPPQGIAKVSALSGGYVKSINLLEGRFLNKGEVLVVLENPEIVQLQQDYLLAKSNASYTQKDYIRQRDLNQDKTSSDKAMQMAQTEANNQHIMVNALAERLRILGINPNTLTSKNIQKSIAIKAPISGYLANINTNLGQFVSPADILFDIINTNDIHLVLNVFEKDLPHLSLNQKVYAYSNHNPEKKYLAHIKLIGKDFGSDRSVKVHCHFTEQPNLATGSFMNAEIETESTDNFTIPEDAVVSWEGRQYVFEEIKPKTFKMQEVNIGKSENSFVEILNPSPELLKKKIVIKGAYKLLMGLKNIED